jgi:MFS family permease
MRSEVTTAEQNSARRASAGRRATASLVGTTLEWYDFTIYNNLAALIFNRLFFPSFDPLTGTILAFSTYAVGYVSRPFGGVIFGHMGDKLGRRTVLVVTLIVMGLTSVAMGLLPTYESIGVSSAILLVTLRFIQGAALGGEWAGAVLIAVEHGKQNQRGRNASWTQCGPALGILLGTGCLALATYLASPEAFLAWVWRIPFAFSIVLVLFGLWVRRGVEETPMFKELAESGAKAKAPIGEVARFHWRRMLIAGGVRIGSDVVYTLALVFPLTYVTTVLNLSRTTALTSIMIATVFNASTIPLFGALSDRLGRRPVYAAGALLSIPWAFAFFAMADTKNPVLIVLAVIMGGILHAAMYGPQGAFIVEQFPTRVRYAGASVSYTMAGIVGAGIAPLIFVSLLRAYQTTTPLSVYVIVSVCITCIALLAARETGKSPMQD